MNAPQRLEAYGLIATRSLGYWDFTFPAGGYVGAGWLPRSMGGLCEEGVAGLLSQMRCQAEMLAAAE